MASAALQTAEELDGYRAACAVSLANAYARREHIYRPFFVEPTIAAALQKEIDAIPLLRDIDIVVMHPTADQGYPHTRPRNVVCVPSSYLTEKDGAELAEMLRHEAVHVHQRQRTEVWAAACMRRGWWPVPASQIPTALRNRCRINPDTMAAPFWSWDTHYVPLPLFSSETPATLGDVVIKWLDLRSGTTYSDPPSSFFAVHGTSVPQPEHPYEIYAVEAAAQGIVDESALKAYLFGTK